MAELAIDSEIAQMRPVIVSLGWIARKCIPDLSYEVSKGQSVVSKATIKDLKEACLAAEKAWPGLPCDSLVLFFRRLASEHDSHHGSSLRPVNDLHAHLNS